VRRGLTVALAFLAGATAAGGEELVRRFGQLTAAVDLTYAQPGGIAVVRFRPALWAGSTFVIFEGRRAPVLPGAGGPRALVPIPAETPAGDGLLGIELFARRGLQRLRLDFPIGERTFSERTQTLNEEKRALLRQPNALRDGRRLMQAVRTFTNDALWRGAFRPPVVPPPSETFGERESYIGGSPVEMMMDGGTSEQHRGLDYAVAVGQLVQAPAGGNVVMAEPLLLTGNTVVLDHGQGIVSMLCHLSQLDVRAGERVETGTRLGLAGDTGVAQFPHVHWAVYLLGIPVDPNVVMKVLE
jgi:murein DD-endopeptidase MepM/ murein hydrolase activator NlpD